MMINRLLTLILSFLLIACNASKIDSKALSVGGCHYTGEVMKNAYSDAEGHSWCVMECNTGKAVKQCTLKQ